MSQNIMNEEVKHVDLNDSSVFNDSLETLWEIQNIQEQLSHAGIMYDVDKLIDDYTEFLEGIKKTSILLSFDSSLTTIS